MNVPLLDLHQQMDGLRDEVMAAVAQVIDSTQYILGPEVTRLEEAVAEYCGVGHAVGVSSGTDALLVSLMALGVGPGDLVLTTPYSFFATMGSIVRVGALPVFADIQPDTMNIDPERMAEALAQDRKSGGRIKAIIPVHLFGQCADMQRIQALAAKYGVPIIEDAAQAIGADCPFGSDGQTTWQRAGAMGMAGCFSFFPSKNLGGIGDGGMVTTPDREFAERLRVFRNHGAKPKYYHSYIGGNFRLDPMQACVLRIKLRHLDAWHQARRNNAAVYRRLFSEAGLAGTSVTLPVAVHGDINGSETRNYHIYNQFVIRVTRRDALRQYLADNGVGCEVYYPLCLHQQECLQGYGDYGRQRYPEAERAASESLALPIYPELTGAQLEYVVTTIAGFFRR
ncbi:MAG: DegT/DnrJ/EryC1/StrS family aminotransferase [Desulfobulbus sp.]|nr:MAG: DegT/DnrJ/EryC1/StrS family aminotransferase [Desulfobulbus sp.]